MKNLIIAIDGTAASGKSTTAKILAKKLGILPIDTGAMYRAVTLKALKLGIPVENREAIEELARSTEITQKLVEGTVRTFLDGVDVTDEIRSPEVDKAVSLVSSYAGVRERLVELQRKMAKQGNVVLEGRDIGTVVLPDAPLKFYMDASLAERARRRLGDLRKKGANPTLEEVMEELKRRDEFDSNREIAPLKKADDAIYIDTTDLTVEAQVEIILEEVEKRFGGDDP